MSLKETITTDMKKAMRARDQQRLTTIRLLQAGIQRREVDERITLDDAQVLAVVEKLIKQSREAIEQFDKGGRKELVEKEQADIAVWQRYLPEPLSEEEIDRLVAKAIADTGAASVKDIGKVMGVLKPKLQGRAEMGKVSGKVKAGLSG